MGAKGWRVEVDWSGVRPCCQEGAGADAPGAEDGCETAAPASQRPPRSVAVWLVQALAIRGSFDGVMFVSRRCSKLRTDSAAHCGSVTRGTLATGRRAATTCEPGAVTRPSC